MKGLEVSIVPLRSMNLRDRSDAEYFSKENLAVEQALRDHQATPLRELCTLASSAFYPAATELYEAGDVPFARCVDCITHPVITRQQDSEFVRIPEWFLRQSAQIDCVSRGDIILTKVGSPCYASVVHDYDRIALSRTVLGLVKIHGVSPYYLTAFLRSRFGFTQLLRQRELTIQYQLTLERVRDVLVYRASPNVQKAVEKTMLAHVAALEETRLRADEAEVLLAAALGLGDWRPPEPLSYSCRASEAFRAARIDAEYFHPAKRSYLDRLGALPGHPLGAYYSPVREMFDPRSAVRGSVVRNFDLNDALNLVLDETKDPVLASEVGSTKKRFSKGDVVTSRLRAYLRETALVRTSDAIPSVGSSEFIVLRRRDNVEPSLSQGALLTFLRSRVDLPRFRRHVG